MKRWIVIGLALAMMAATAGWLSNVAGHVTLGKPGVQVEPAALYRADGELMTNRRVLLPADVPGFSSELGGPTGSELSGLPADTTFGRRIYTNHDLRIQLTAVLMGTDHTSIHQPQYCLDAQGWKITNQEQIVLHIKKPMEYDLPAMKLMSSQLQADGRTTQGVYIYWFVSGEKITAEEGTRLWSLWRNILEKGVMERWAYISYFAPCRPGEDSVNVAELQKFIEATAPEVQTVTPRPLSHPEDQ